MYPDVTRPWYADDAGGLGTFDNLCRYFNSLKVHGPTQGYYPKPTKSIIIVHPRNIKAGGIFGRFYGFNVCMGARYIGDYIKDDEYKVNCLKNRMEKWERNIHAITEIADKYPQESDTAVACAIQSEWIFFQRATKDMGQAFKGLENLCGKYVCLVFPLEDQKSSLRLWDI